LLSLALSLYSPSSSQRLHHCTYNKHKTTSNPPLNFEKFAFRTYSVCSHFNCRQHNLTWAQHHHHIIIHYHSGPTCLKGGGPTTRTSTRCQLFGLDGSCLRQNSATVRNLPAWPHLLASKISEEKKRRKSVSRSNQSIRATHFLATETESFHWTFCDLISSQNNFVLVAVRRATCE